jgi:hypothetical protein
MTGRCGPRGPIRDDHCGKNLPDSGNDFPHRCGNDLRRGPGPMKRGDRGRWGGCRPPQTASQCAKVVVITATERKGRQP